MKQFRTVLKFEYLNYVKSKAFIIVTGFLLVLIIAGSLFPQIKSGLDGLFGSEPAEEVAELLDAAFYDESGQYSADFLSLYAPEYNWTELQSPENIEKQIEDDTFSLAIHIDGLNIDFYELGSESFYSYASVAIPEAVKSIYQSSYLSDAGLSDTEISEVLSAEPIVTSIPVGKDTGQSFWMSYIVIFVLYFALLYYGGSIGSAVVIEKTSKAMELLVTSAKPMPLMFGKVFGVGLAGLSQLGLIIIVAILGINLNIDRWTEAFPAVAAILQTSLAVDILIYAIVYFLLGFFSYAFIYAALSSTVSRVEDASSVTTIPTMLVVVSFIVAMSGLATPDAFHLKVLSFVPFVSTMVMYMRICLLDIPTWQILTCVGANVIYILILGFISARIYRVGIMLYGNKPKLKDIFRYIKG